MIHATDPFKTEPNRTDPNPSETQNKNQNKAVFGDGSTFECDVIVACTGYKNTFPFAEETHPDINEYGQNPRLLYKQIFHPNYNSEIAYFGFARPAFGSIPPTSEMQSRFYAMVVNGDLSLPCRGKMVKVALEDKVRRRSLALALALMMLSVALICLLFSSFDAFATAAFCLV